LLLAAFLMASCTFSADSGLDVQAELSSGAEFSSGPSLSQGTHLSSSATAHSNASLSSAGGVAGLSSGWQTYLSSGWEQYLSSGTLNFSSYTPGEAPSGALLSCTITQATLGQLCTETAMADATLDAAATCLSQQGIVGTGCITDAALACPGIQLNGGTVPSNAYVYGTQGAMLLQLAGGCSALAALLAAQ
jgi:hypothetical protein